MHDQKPTGSGPETTTVKRHYKIYTKQILKQMTPELSEQSKHIFFKTL